MRHVCHTLRGNTVVGCREGNSFELYTCSHSGCQMSFV